MGKGYSIRNGILNSRGKYIIFTDIDMAYSKSNLLSVLEKLESGHPLVVGNRRLPESVYVVNNALVRYVYRRHRGGNAFNTLVRLLFGLTTRDTQSGLKGFSRNAARWNISAGLHRRLPLRHRDLHPQPHSGDTGHRSAGAADLRGRHHHRPAVQLPVFR